MGDSSSFFSSVLLPPWHLSRESEGSDFYGRENFAAAYCYSGGNSPVMVKGSEDGGRGSRPSSPRYFSRRFGLLFR
jgi:hypothetical protein